jgi:hypothetical protein
MKRHILKDQTTSYPDALLDAWVIAYEAPLHKRLSFYTTLHDTSLTNAVRALLSAYPETGQIMLASSSAANWLSPMAV